MIKHRERRKSNQKAPRENNTWLVKFNSKDSGFLTETEVSSRQAATWPQGTGELFLELSLDVCVRPTMETHLPTHSGCGLSHVYYFLLSNVL